MLAAALWPPVGILVLYRRNCKGSSAFSARVAAGSIKLILNEPIMRFHMCLWEQGYICVQLYTELIALPPNVIHIKCYDFDVPMKYSSNFASLDLRRFSLL
jgi:hypothetical protein